MSHGHSNVGGGSEGGRQRPRCRAFRRTPIAPQFDRPARDPGYVKAYPLGVRENGGQHIHAVSWSTMAFAAFGDGDKAVTLFSLLDPINLARARRRESRGRRGPASTSSELQ